MKVVKKYEVPTADFDTFLTEHYKETMQVKPTATGYSVSIFTDMTQTEFHMNTLRLLADSNTVTGEEKDAINYGISAIKTLEDMGIII